MYMIAMTRKYAPNNIRPLRKAAGMSMEELAATFEPEVAIATIAKLETGKMGLTLDYINQIANALQVPPSAVIGGPIIRMIPLIGSIAAGAWQEPIEADGEKVPVPDHVGGPNCFALRPNGDSMDLLVPPGDDTFIVVDPAQRELRVGKAYAVQRHDGDVTFKRFMADPPRLEPVSSNPAHQPIPLGIEPFVVIGRVTFTGGAL